MHGPVPVLFPLEKNKPLVELKFGVNVALAFEEECGANPAFLMRSGKQLYATVHMLKYGLQHIDPSMNELKAKKLIQRYLDNNGTMDKLSEALIKAYGNSGVYGDRNNWLLDDDEDKDGEAGDPDPS